MTRMTMTEATCGGHLEGVGSRPGSPLPDEHSHLRGAGQSGIRGSELPTSGEAQRLSIFPGGGPTANA